MVEPFLVDGFEVFERLGCVGAVDGLVDCGLPCGRVCRSGLGLGFVVRLAHVLRGAAFLGIAFGAFLDLAAIAAGVERAGSFLVHLSHAAGVEDFAGCHVHLLVFGL